MGRCPQQSASGRGAGKGDPLASICPVFMRGVYYMRVLLISKSSMNITDLQNVSNIAESGSNYAVTVSGTTTNYEMASWYIQIIWA